MSFRHLSYILSGAAVLLLAATACTQDELADGTRLPEGEYPLIINATGLSVEATPASRATVDGNWDGVTSVALSLGDETKEYSVTASATDGYKTATLSNNLSPFWWTTKAQRTTLQPATTFQPRTRRCTSTTRLWSSAIARRV